MKFSSTSGYKHAHTHAHAYSYKIPMYGWRRLWSSTCRKQGLCRRGLPGRKFLIVFLEWVNLVDVEQTALQQVCTCLLKERPGDARGRKREKREERDHTHILAHSRQHSCSCSSVGKRQLHCATQTGKVSEGRRRERREREKRERIEIFRLHLICLCHSKEGLGVLV